MPNKFHCTEDINKPPLAKVPSPPPPGTKSATPASASFAQYPDMPIKKGL